VLRKHGRPASWRQLMPAAFVAALLLATLLLPAWRAPWFILLGSYAVYLLGCALQATAERDWEVAWRLPAVVAAYHLGYGLGTWKGVWHVLTRRSASASDLRLTR
jgi:succinoglycan biosynthesis protein ExoA